AMKFLVGLPVIPCSAETGFNVESTLRTLLYLSMMQWSSVFTKFAEFSGADDGLRNLMAHLNLERQQAVSYLRRFELRKLLEVTVGDESFTVKESVRHILENPAMIMKR
ncbi:MAG: hypothetical protein RTU30_11945, partial [Candidatus Thorarchaeota archaeon]